MSPYGIQMHVNKIIFDRLKTVNGKEENGGNFV